METLEVDMAAATAVGSRLRLSLTFVLLGLVLGSPALASEAQERKSDFLFGPPRGHVGVRGGWLFASAGSDVFEFFTSNLTVESGAFSAPSIGFDIGYRLHPNVDILFGVDFTQPSPTSEYRDFVEDNGLPILQETKLSAVPVSGSVKLYPASRGREISRYAFIPRAVVPFVGGGAGVMWYKLEQEGDFVDFRDLAIFSAYLESKGIGLSYHAFGGVDIHLHGRMFLSVEARYVWAEAELGTDFVGFAPIDLSGLRSTVAFNLFF
jgi:hypothetical protein